MSIVIKVIGRGEALYENPIWVKSYDPSGAGLVVTNQSGSAKVFSDMEAALECYRQVDERNPVRPDGKPNRPLTGFHVEFAHP